MKKSFKQYVAAILIAGTILLGLGAAAHAETQTPTSPPHDRNAGGIIAAFDVISSASDMISKIGAIIDTLSTSKTARAIFYKIGEPTVSMLNLTDADPVVVGGGVIAATIALGKLGFDLIDNLLCGDRR